MRRSTTRFTIVLSLLVGFLTVSVLLGLLGACLVIPTVAASGAAARQGVHAFDSLPRDFIQSPLSQQSRILASDGTVIATPYDENRVIVPLARIAPVMRQAQIAIEDSRFYDHGGIDVQALGRAFVSNLGGGAIQGASTLTQQFVKITLQENAIRKNDAAAARAALAKNYARKVQELKYAITLEQTLTKDQILEGYLNLVYYGDQTYGVEAAARNYFGVSAAKLTLPQAATLAGIVRLPSETDPIHNPASALARRDVVLDRMHNLNLITDKAWLVAKATKLVINHKPSQSSCAVSPYPYFCTYVTAWLLQQPALGKTVRERSERVNRGGLTIQTTLNPKMQLAAEQELTAKVPIGNREQIGAATAIVEPGTGHVLAIAQNTHYSITNGRGKTSVNWAVDRRYGGSGGFAFGSTAKMFAVAQALTSGMSVSSSVVVRKADASHAAVFTRADFQSSDSCKIGAGQRWLVHNDEGSAKGTISLTVATAKSVNTAFAGLVAKLGACKVRDLMTQMGLHQGNGDPISTFPSPITLGSDSTSPLTLASAYATVAAGGIYCVPSPILTISTSNHHKLAVPKNSCSRALQADVANDVTKILKTVLTNGTAARTGGLSDGRPAAGKTGTSEGSNETWFVGYTPQLCTAVWVGTPDDFRNKRILRNLQLGDDFYGGQIFGATIAAPTWKRIMDRASAEMPVVDFDGTGGTLLQGDLMSMPSVAGFSVSHAKRVLAEAGFRPQVGYAVTSKIAKGKAVGTEPSYQASLGSTVVIITSKGPAPKKPPKAAPNTH